MKTKSRQEKAAKGRVRATIGKTAAHGAKPARQTADAAKPAQKASKVADSHDKSERKTKQKS